jgi:hypothetical protein
MQIELLNRKNWTTVLEFSTATTEWICDFYNPIQRHSALATSRPTSTKPCTPNKTGPHSHKVRSAQWGQPHMG